MSLPRDPVSGQGAEDQVRTGLGSDTPYVPIRTPDEQARRQRAAADLLATWLREGDEAEQRETLAVLREALGL